MENEVHFSANDLLKHRLSFTSIDWSATENERVPFDLRLQCMLHGKAKQFLTLMDSVLTNNESSRELTPTTITLVSPNAPPIDEPELISNECERRASNESNSWKVTRRSSDEVALKNDATISQLRFRLNQMTPQRFFEQKEIAMDIIRQQVHDDRGMSLVIELLLDCGFKQPKFTHLFTQMLSFLHSRLYEVPHWNVMEQSDEKRFCGMISRRIIALFEKYRQQNSKSKEDKHRFFAIMVLIAGLFRVRLLSKSVIFRDVFDELLPPKNANLCRVDIEGICRLLRHCGKLLDKHESFVIDAYLDKLLFFAQAFYPGFRTKVLIQSIVQQSVNEWKYPFDADGDAHSHLVDGDLMIHHSQIQITKKKPVASPYLKAVKAPKNVNAFERIERWKEFTKLIGQNCDFSNFNELQEAVMGDLCAGNDAIIVGSAGIGKSTAIVLSSMYRLMTTQSLKTNILIFVGSPAHARWFKKMCIKMGKNIKDFHVRVTRNSKGAIESKKWEELFHRGRKIHIFVHSDPKIVEMLLQRPQIRKYLLSVHIFDADAVLVEPKMSKFKSFFDWLPDGVNLNFISQSFCAQMDENIKKMSPNASKHIFDNEHYQHVNFWFVVNEADNAPISALSQLCKINPFKQGIIFCAELATAIQVGKTLTSSKFGSIKCRVLRSDCPRSVINCFNEGSVQYIVAHDDSSIYFLKNIKQDLLRVIVNFTLHSAALYLRRCVIGKYSKKPAKIHYISLIDEAQKKIYFDVESVCDVRLIKFAPEGVFGSDYPKSNSLSCNQSSSMSGDPMMSQMSKSSVKSNFSSSISCDEMDSNGLRALSKFLKPIFSKKVDEPTDNEDWANKCVLCGKEYAACNCI